MIVDVCAFARVSIPLGVLERARERGGLRECLVSSAASVSRVLIWAFRRRGVDLEGVLSPVRVPRCFAVLICADLSFH